MILKNIMKQLFKNVATILIVGALITVEGCKKDENTPENNNTEIISNIRNSYVPLEKREVDSILKTDYGINNLEKVGIELIKKDPLIFTKVINKDTLSKDFKFLILIKKKNNQIITFAKKQDNKSIHSSWRFLDEGIPRSFPPPVYGGRYICGHSVGDPNCIHSVQELGEVVVTGRIVDHYKEGIPIIAMYPNFDCLMKELDIMYAMDWDGGDGYIFYDTGDFSLCQEVYYPPNNSGGGNNSEGKQEDNIIDRLNNPCAKALLAQAPNLNNDIARILRQTFGTNNKYNLTFLEDNALRGTSVDAYCRPTSVSDKDAEINIFLNPDILNSATKEYVLVTIYHEAIHAFLSCERERLREKFQERYPNIRYRTAMGFGNGVAYDKFEFIDDKHLNFAPFIDSLVDAIHSFNPNIPLNTAKAMAKTGIIKNVFDWEVKLNQNEREGNNDRKGTKCTP